MYILINHILIVKLIFESNIPHKLCTLSSVFATQISTSLEFSISALIDSILTKGESTVIINIFD